MSASRLEPVPRCKVIDGSSKSIFNCLDQVSSITSNFYMQRSIDVCL
jgi:hypothetical protein